MVQRYKFESKSQLARSRATFLSVVSNGSKVQIWKQITTISQDITKTSKLFPMVQRYKFESKSQPIQVHTIVFSCCFQWFKGTNLKANHNIDKKVARERAVVSNGSKVQIWKQITTKIVVCQSK